MSSRWSISLFIFGDSISYPDDLAFYLYFVANILISVEKKTQREWDEEVKIGGSNFSPVTLTNSRYEKEKNKREKNHQLNNTN